MKIIDKQKDYYDYLVGEYGLDPLYTYVRNSPSKTSNIIYRFKEILKYFTSNDILQFDEEKHYQKFGGIHESNSLFQSYYGRIISFHIIIGLHCFRFECNRYIEKKKLYKEIRYKEIINFVRESDAPIYVKSPYNLIYNYKSENTFLIENPIIEDLGLATYFDPHDIWRWIIEYLASLKNVESTPLTDKEKIISHGFDLKSSFRNIK